MYALEYADDWDHYFEKVPLNIQRRFWKRKEKYASFPSFAFRHEKHGIEFFVDEVGQYRVLFIADENLLVRRFHFIGDHKEYEKFIGIRK